VIKQLTEPFEPWDSFSCRVHAVWKTYDDAQCWTQSSNAVISLVDGFAILAAKKQADWEELTAFLQFQPWARLQCDSAVELPFTTKWSSLIMRLTSPKQLPVSADIIPAHDPRIVRDIHGKNDVWMANLALRWRRGTTQTWTLNNVSTASAAAITPEHIYIGAVETLPEHRRQGYASQLVAHICEEYRDRTVWLNCREELRGLYENLGFEQMGTRQMITMKKEDL